MRFVRYIIFAVVLAPLCVSTNAKDSATEIEYLLTSVGSSHCAFVRNGERIALKKPKNTYA